MNFVAGSSPRVVFLIHLLPLLVSVFQGQIILRIVKLKFYNLAIIGRTLPPPPSSCFPDQSLAALLHLRAISSEHLPAKLSVMGEQREQRDTQPLNLPLPRGTASAFHHISLWAQLAPCPQSISNGKGAQEM